MENQHIQEPCKSCKGHCCKVGFIVQVFPDEKIYNDSELVHQYNWPLENVPFRNMKSNGDGYTCIALGKDGECTIWQKRPQACKDFAADGKRCKALRKEYDRP